RLARAGRVLALGLLASAIAAAMYWPWYSFVERHGGYADLIRHHRSYMGGTGSWVRNWRIQLAQVIAFSGGLTWGAGAWITAWIAAAYAVLRRSSGGSSDRWRGARFRLGLVVGATALAALPDLAWWAGLASVGWLAKGTNPDRRVLVACWLVLSVMTPFYH